MPWTRLDIAILTSALILSATMLGHRTWQHLSLEQAADQVLENILTVTETVQQYHQNTGRWFPEKESDGRVKVYPDPFHTDELSYQGLDETRLFFQANFGMVLQLVKFDANLDRAVPLNLFDEPFNEGEPFLRVLLDYGNLGQVEKQILLRVQERLPQGSIAELDDHYYLIDLRRLMHVEQ